MAWKKIVAAHFLPETSLSIAIAVHIAVAEREGRKRFTEAEEPRPKLISQVAREKNM